jgi:hypothetical protein
LLNADGTEVTAGSGLSLTGGTISSANNKITYLSSVAAETKLHAHFNGSDGSTTFVDSSMSPLTSATFSGAAAIKTAQSKFGGSSLYLNGVNTAKFKVTNTNSKVNFNSGDFTIEMWYYPVANVQWASLISFNTSAWYQGPVLLFNNANGLYLENSYGGSNQWNLNTSQGNMTLNQWYHIAVVGTSNQHVKIYVNGTLVGTRNGSYTFSIPAGGDIYLGHSAFFPAGVGPVSSINGYIDEVRISTVARYSANFTPSTTAFADNNSSSELAATSAGDVIHTAEGIYICTSLSPLTWKKFAASSTVLPV